MTTTVVITPNAHKVQVVATEVNSVGFTQMIEPNSDPVTLYVWDGHSLTISEVPSEPAT